VRTFITGATRDQDDTKHDPDGFLSPLVLERFFDYMTQHRIQADGKRRDSDNWQKGIPLDAYRKSAWRHFFDFWKEGRRPTGVRPALIEEALCALMFNIMGYLHEHLKAGRSKDYAPGEPFLVELRGRIVAMPNPGAIVKQIETAEGGPQ
jgi:hypothetical protein